MNLKTYLSTLERGRVSGLAKDLEISPSYLSQMASGAAPISFSRCIEIEKATNGAVCCEDMRPDIDWAYLRNSSKATGKKR